MRVHWSNGGLRFDPQTPHEVDVLKAVLEFLKTTKFKFTSAGSLLDTFEEVYGPIVVSDPNDERTVVPMQQRG